MQTLSVYKSGILRSSSSISIGFVCVLGGRFFKILSIFFWVRIRGWSRVLFGLFVPQIDIAPIR